MRGATLVLVAIVCATLADRLGKVQIGRSLRGFGVRV